MPSTRRQKAKARKSREMDMMSDFENLDVMLGSENNNTDNNRSIIGPRGR